MPEPSAASVKEQQRLEAVRRYDVLDTPPDGAFDHITALASKLLRAPIAIVSIVDHDRIWFKSRHGLKIEQIDRDPGLCASCILQDGPWIVNDARADPRALANPLVAGAFGAQFYLGIPLRTQEGCNLGTLCILDFAPRQVTDDQVSILSHLAAIVMDELELRLSARQADTRYQEELARRELREDHIRSLLRELAHRSKNLLAVVMALAHQTAPNTRSVSDYVVGLTARVRALAFTHDLIADEEWRGVSIKELALAQLAPFVGDNPHRIRYDGQYLVVRPGPAQTIGLALHELVTNAVKHGALSVPRGRVHLAWHHEPPLVRMSWSEYNGPPLTPTIPQHGFGCVVLARLTPEALSGDAALQFTAEGVRWTLNVPTHHFL